MFLQKILSIKLKALRALSVRQTEQSFVFSIISANTNTPETLKSIGSLQSIIPQQRKCRREAKKAMHNSYVESPLLLMEYLYIQPNYSHKGTLKLCLATRKRYDDELKQTSLEHKSNFSYLYVTTHLYTKSFLLYN